MMQIHISLLHSISATPRFGLRAPSFANASADNPTSFYDCNSSQCPGNLARLPPQSLAVQQEPTPHWVADGSGSKIWTDKLANSPFAGFLVSDTCLWDKYQATEMFCSEEALSCAPNSTTLTSEKTQEKLFVPAPRGTTHRRTRRKAARTTSSPRSVLNWRPVLTLDKPGQSHVRIRSPLWPSPRSNFFSIDPLFDLPRTCEHLPASHPIHLAAVFSGKLPQTLDVSLMSKPRETDVRRHSWSHKTKHTQTKTYLTERSKLLPFME